MSSKKKIRGQGQQGFAGVMTGITEQDVQKLIGDKVQQQAQKIVQSLMPADAKGRSYNAKFGVWECKRFVGGLTLLEAFGPYDQVVQLFASIKSRSMRHMSTIGIAKHDFENHGAHGVFILRGETQGMLSKKQLKITKAYVAEALNPNKYAYIWYFRNMGDGLFLVTHTPDLDEVRNSHQIVKQLLARVFSQKTGTVLRSKVTGTYLITPEGVGRKTTAYWNDEVRALPPAFVGEDPSKIRNTSVGEVFLACLEGTQHIQGITKADIIGMFESASDGQTAAAAWQNLKIAGAGFKGGLVDISFPVVVSGFETNRVIFTMCDGELYNLAGVDINLNDNSITCNAGKGKMLTGIKKDAMAKLGAVLKYDDQKGAIGINTGANYVSWNAGNVFAGQNLKLLTSDIDVAALAAAQFKTQTAHQPD